MFPSSSDSLRSPSRPASAAIPTACASLLLASLTPASVLAVEQSHLASRLDSSCRSLGRRVFDEFSALSRHQEARLTNNATDIKETLQIVGMLMADGEVCQRMEHILQTMKSLNIK